MHTRSHIVSICAAALIGALPSVATSNSHMGGYDIRAFDDIEFMLFGEGPLEIAVLWGDPTWGPSGYLLRIPAGFEAPVHTHTANYRAVIIEGAALHWIEGEDPMAAAPVGPGGYWYQPGGQMHGDANPTDGPSLALVIMDGPVDFLMPE
jgi:hypothetical protein